MVPFVFSKATNLRFLAPFALATEKQTAIILGPGESIVVNSATQHNTFILNGFSETSDEFTIGYSI